MPDTLSITATEAADLPPPCTSHPLPCPRCGESDANITVELAGLDADDACQCLSCNEAFGLNEVRAVVARWKPILAWLDSIPHPEA